MATPINTPRARADVYDKSLPANIEAEKSILGAVLLDNAALEIAMRHCTPNDFFLPENRYLIRAFVELAKAGQPIDTVILVEYLGKREQLQASGGAPYISQITDGLPKVTNVEHYAKIVAEKAALRAIVREAFDVQQKAMATDADLPLLQRQLGASAGIHGKANGNGAKLSFGLMEFLSHEFPNPEHLIEGLIPRGGSALIVAMPHHLKSWFTVGLALGASVPGTLLGKLEVAKPVRSYLASIEDPGGTLQWRIKQLMKTGTFRDVEPSLVKICPRTQGAYDIMDEQTFQWLCRDAKDHKSELVILDVLRRWFQGDINSPKESAALCEQFDRLRDITGAALLVVHHENRKEADLMRAAAGSFNIPGWANAVIQFKRKMQQGELISHVEIEVDNKLGKSLEPVRMTLDFSSDVLLRIEALEDSEAVTEIREKLGQEWTVRDLAEALDVHKANAYRRLKKLLSSGVVEKIKGGKRGRIGGLARYCFVEDASADDDDAKPTPRGRVN
jgi:DNA-binding transcriptional ArsR family regulator